MITIYKLGDTAHEASINREWFITPEQAIPYNIFNKKIYRVTIQDLQEYENNKQTCIENPK